MFRSIEKKSRVLLSGLAFGVASLAVGSATAAEAATTSTTSPSGVVLSPPKQEGTSGSSTVEPEQPERNYTTNDVPKPVLRIVGSIFNGTHLEGLIGGYAYGATVTKRLPGDSEVIVSAQFESEHIGGELEKPVLPNGRPNAEMLGNLMVRIVQPHSNATLDFSGDGQFWSSYGVYGPGRGDDKLIPDIFPYAQKHAVEEWEFSTSPYPTEGKTTGAAGKATFGTTKGEYSYRYEGQFSIGTTFANTTSKPSVITHDTNLFLSRLATEASYAVNAANHNSALASIKPVPTEGMITDHHVKIPA